MSVWYNLLLTANYAEKLYFSLNKLCSAVKQSRWCMAGAVWGLFKGDWVKTWLHLHLLPFATSVFFLLRPKAKHLQLSVSYHWKKCRCLHSSCLSPCQCVIIALRHLSFLQTNLAASRPPTNHECNQVGPDKGPRITTSDQKSGRDI